MTRWGTWCCRQHGTRCTPGERAQLMAQWLLLQPQQCTLAPPVARLGKHARARTHGVFYRESGVESEKVRGGQRAAVHHNPLSKRCFFCQHQMVVGRVRQYTTATQCSTIWHLPTLPSDSAFPSAVGFVRARTQGHKTRHNVPAGASAAPPARHKSVHQHEGRGQPTWQTNRDCT